MILTAKTRTTAPETPGTGYVKLYVDTSTKKLILIDEEGVEHEYVITTDLSVFALASALSDYALTSALSDYALTSALSDYALTTAVLDIFKDTRTLGDNYVVIDEPGVTTTFQRGTVLTAERNVAIDATDIINVAGVTAEEKTDILLEMGYKIRIFGTLTKDGIYSGATADLVWTDESGGLTWTMKTSANAIGLAESGTCLVTVGESYVQIAGSHVILEENDVLRVSGVDDNYNGSYTIYETQIIGNTTRYWLNELLPEPTETIIAATLEYIDGKNYVITHNLGSERIRISGYFTDSPLPDPSAVWQYFDNKDTFFTINDENSIEADMLQFVEGDTIILLIEKLD